MLRYLDPSEHYFWLLDQVSSMNFAVIAEFSQFQDIAALQNALNILQQQPVFQLAISQDDNGRLLLQQHSQPVMLETFARCDDWQQVISTALAERFSQAQPLIRALYCEPASQSEATSDTTCIALLFSHAIADGRTGAELLQQWLNILAGEAPGEYETTQIAALHQKLPAALNITDQPQRIAEYKQLKKEEMTRFGRFDYLPKPIAKGDISVTDSPQPRIIRLEFTAEQSARIKQQCQEHNVRFHSALTAAQLLAIYQHEDQANATLCLTSPVDMRRYFDDPQVTLGMHTALLSAVYQITPDSDFWSVAKTADGELHRQIQRDDAARFYQLMRPELIPCTDAALDNFSSAILRTPANTLISNLGVLKPSPKDDVDRISFALCPMPFQPLFTAATHYKGKLQLNITYDRTRIDCNTAHSITDRMFEQLSGLQSTVNTIRRT